ncbi:MAG TPA: PASTA domain-containing protein, partial [Thermoanaerobaculia bacterium]
NFTITTPVDTVRLGADGQGSMVFTVANSAAGPNSGMAKLAPLGETKAEWLTLTGETVREFPAGGTHQFSVAANVPAGTPPGRYTWRFDMVSARRAGEERDEGPVVGFEVQATEAKKKGMPWWVWAAAAAVVLVVGAVVAIVAGRGGSTRGAAPNVVGQHVVDAIVAVQAAGYRTPLAGRQSATATPGTVVDQVEGEGGVVQLGVATATGAGIVLAQADQERLGVQAVDALRKEFPLAPGTIELPDFQNADMVKAIIDVERLGLMPDVKLQASAPASTGKVMTQVPGPKNPVAKATTVQLVVGTGPGPFRPPPKFGTLSQATQMDVMRQATQMQHNNNSFGKVTAARRLPVVATGTQQ